MTSRRKERREMSAGLGPCPGERELLMSRHRGGDFGDGQSGELVDRLDFNIDVVARSRREADRDVGKLGVGIGELLT